MDNKYVNEYGNTNSTNHNQCAYSLSVDFHERIFSEIISNAPYFDHNFHSVSHNFSISWQYFEGVLFWPVLVLIALLVAILCLVVYLCLLIRFIKKSRNEEFTIWCRKPYVFLTLLLLLYLTGIVLSCTCIWPDISIRNTLYDVIDMSQQANIFINQIKSGQTIVNNTTNSISK